jgi:hypothetical protein
LLNEFKSFLPESAHNAAHLQDSFQPLNEQSQMHMDKVIFCAFIFPIPFLFFLMGYEWWADHPVNSLSNVYGRLGPLLPMLIVISVSIILNWKMKSNGENAQ